MYSIKQEFIIDGKIKTVEVKSNEFMKFKEEYFEKSKLPNCNYASFIEDENLSARIYLSIMFYNENDLEIKRKIIKALAPVFEIGLDNAFSEVDAQYLINYRSRGFEYKEEDYCIEFSLGDSNKPEISFSMISLVYALIYDEKILDKLYKKFESINENIIDGGFNSASFNGLQGYYFSNYFVKWLLDMRKYASHNKLISIENFQALYDLIENLENPKDKFM